MTAYPLTAEEARGRARAAAGRLHAAGLRPGDRVAVLTPESDLAPAAAASAQAAVVSRDGGTANGHRPGDDQPAAARRGSPGLRRRCSGGGARDNATRWFRRPRALALTDESGAPWIGVEMADVPLGRPMHFTSGTTGRSKGVWAGVLDEGTAHAYWQDEADQWSMAANDTVLNHGPLAHSAPLRFSILAMIAGATVVFTGTFDTARMSEAMVEFSPTVAMAVPTHLQRLLLQPGGHRRPRTGCWPTLALRVPRPETCHPLLGGEEQVGVPRIH